MAIVGRPITAAVIRPGGLSRGRGPGGEVGAREAPARGRRPLFRPPSTRPPPTLPPPSAQASGLIMLAAHGPTRGYRWAYFIYEMSGSITQVVDQTIRFEDHD